MHVRSKSPLHLLFAVTIVANSVTAAPLCSELFKVSSTQIVQKQSTYEDVLPVTNKELAALPKAQQQFHLAISALTPERAGELIRFLYEHPDTLFAESFAKVIQDHFLEHAKSLREFQTKSGLDDKTKISSGIIDSLLFKFNHVGSFTMRSDEYSALQSDLPRPTRWTEKYISYRFVTFYEISVPFSDYYKIAKSDSGDRTSTEKLLYSVGTKYLKSINTTFEEHADVHDFVKRLSDDDRKFAEALLLANIDALATYAYKGKSKGILAHALGVLQTGISGSATSAVAVLASGAPEAAIVGLFPIALGQLLKRDEIMLNQITYNGGLARTISQRNRGVERQKAKALINNSLATLAQGVPKALADGSKSSSNKILQEQTKGRRKALKDPKILSFPVVDHEAVLQVYKLNLTIAQLEQLSPDHDLDLSGGLSNREIYEFGEVLRDESMQLSAQSMTLARLLSEASAQIESTTKNINKKMTTEQAIAQADNLKQYKSLIVGASDECERLESYLKVYTEKLRAYSSHASRVAESIDDSRTRQKLTLVASDLLKEAIGSELLLQSVSTNAALMPTLISTLSELRQKLAYYKQEQFDELTALVRKLHESTRKFSQN